MRRPLAALASILVLVASDARAQANLGFRGYVTFGPTILSADESFEAVAGKSSQTGIGFGGSIDRIWKDLFVDVGISRLKIDGQRVFVFDGTVFPLDIPLTIEMRPIDVIVGWRHTAGRWSPYGGGGISMMNYTESSPFAESGDDVSANEMGLGLLGGLDFSATPWLGVGAEVRFRRITRVLGVGGVSQEFNEDQLGGLSFAVRLSVGRLARAPGPAAPAQPETRPRPVAPPPPTEQPRPSVQEPRSVSYPGAQTSVAWAFVSDSAIRDVDELSELTISDRTARGFSVATTANYRRWFGATTEVSASFWSGESHDLIHRWMLLVGPTFTARQSRVQPFGQVLAGAAYSRGGVPALGLSFEGWDFAVQPGGGVDIVLSPRIALRAALDGRVLADKFLSGETTTQLRFTVGLTFFHGQF
jgi:opacity protein-like surface antigen